MIFDDIQKEDLFIKGLVEYNNRSFYDAHEFWEELWSDYKLEEPNLIQGLIQVSVGYFHLSNLNRKGAIGLFTKCIKKLSPYQTSTLLPVDLSSILSDVSTTLEWIEKNDNLKEFKWEKFKTISMQ